MESGPPLVSVIIPTYNRAEWLRQALESVFVQTWRDFEVIVVDDGSTDSSEQVVADCGDRVQYIRQENGGAANARNRGVTAARGEWIAFLDSDDLWLPHKLDRCMDRIRRDSKTVFVFHPMVEIDENGGVVRGRSKRPAEGRVLDRLFAHCFVHTPTVVVRRDVLDEAGGFDPALEVCEDYALWIRIASKHPFTLVDEPLARRRLHEDRLSKSVMHRNMIQRAQMLEQFYCRQGGRDLLDPRRATKRLARVFRSAAKANLRARRFADAHALLQRSWAYRPLAIKTVLLMAYSAARRDSAMDCSSHMLKPAEELSA